MPRQVHARLRAALACLGALTGCAGRPTGPATTVGVSTAFPPLPAQNDAGAADAGEPLDAGVTTTDAGPAPISPLLPDAELQRLLSPSTAGPRGASGLVLHVAERGPDEPWMVAVVNEGDKPAQLDADTRLFWLNITAPGAKKVRRCRLPSDLLPKANEPRPIVELDPGQYVAQLVDPRLYCFSSSRPRRLVPGARAVAHLGWPERSNETIWVHGAKVSEPVAQPPPFVAHLNEVNVDAALSARAAALKVSRALRYKKGVKHPSAAELGVPLPAGIDKQLSGPDLTLRRTYDLDDMDQEKATSKPGPLEIRLVRGSDAKTEYNATVELTLHNRSKHKLLVYFRRELVTLRVLGPSGIAYCNPGPDARAPDPEAFHSLAPGASRSYTSRLEELCPRGTFESPGLYIIDARYDAKNPGTEWDLAAFTGSIATRRPVDVRIRHDDFPMVHVFAVRAREALAAANNVKP